MDGISENILKHNYVEDSMTDILMSIFIDPLWWFYSLLTMPNSDCLVLKYYMSLYLALAKRLSLVR